VSSSSPKLWVKLDSAREEYQHAIGAHPEQSEFNHLGTNAPDLSCIVARGQLPQILIDDDKIDTSLTNLGLTKTTYSPGTSDKSYFIYTV
jgi:hypothetical protein